MSKPTETNAQKESKPATGTGISEEPRTYKKRWAILAMFCCLSMSNAFQWTEYTIISGIIEKYYNVTLTAVTWTSMIYMLTYIPLVFPASWLLDKYGLRLTCLLGACGNCFGSWVKCGSVSPDRFWVTFVGQTIVGASQIFTLGLPPRLAAVWFGPKEVSTACSLGVFGNQIGIAIGFLVPPQIVRDVPGVESTHVPQNGSNDTLSTFSTAPANISELFYESVTKDLLVMFIGSASFNTLILLIIVLFFSDKPKTPPSLAQLSAVEAGIEKNYLGSLKQLCLNKYYVMLVVSYGINTGAFYAVASLFYSILGPFYPGQEVLFGWVGFVMVLAGIVGTIACGIWLDKTKKYRLTVIVVYVFSLIGMVLYTILVDVGGLELVFVIIGFLGFFMTGYLALGFEYASELTYPISEGTSSGLLNASAQVFGLAMTQGAEQLISVSGFVSNICVSACLAVGTVITVLTKGEMRRLNTELRAKEEEMKKKKEAAAPVILMPPPSYRGESTSEKSARGTQ